MNSTRTPILAAFAAGLALAACKEEAPARQAPPPPKVTVARPVVRDFEESLNNPLEWDAKRFPAMEGDQQVVQPFSRMHGSLPLKTGINARVPGHREV